MKARETDLYQVKQGEKMNEWLPFFVPYFSSEIEAAAFVDECESINPGYRPQEELDDSAPQIMMHQTVRLISLADKTPLLTCEHSLLSLFFMVVCAECVAKLFKHYDSHKESEKFVREFFNEHVSAEDRQKLTTSFSWYRTTPPPFKRRMSFNAVINLLYDIRCDVAHEGMFWGFSFPDGTHGNSRLNCHPKHPKKEEKHPKHPKKEKSVSVTASIKDIRDIVVRGCISAVMKALKNHQPAH